MLTPELKEIGFSEREIKVYTALLELQESTVGPIAAKTRIQHAKIYPTLEKLIDKGVVTYIMRSKTKYFQALPPHTLFSILKEKEIRVKHAIKVLEEIRRKGQEPQTAKVYEGYKAIKVMYEQIVNELDENGFYYVFAFTDEYVTSPLASRFLRNLHQKLAEKKTDDRLIAHSSIKKSFVNNYGDIEGIRFKFTRASIPPGLLVTNTRVINWIWGERPTAFEIVSEQIANSYKEFFLEIWNGSQ